jgi:transaldolase
MQFFIDTASIEDIKYYKSLGLADGVTTNPALLAKEGFDPLEQIKKIADLVPGPISAEVTYTEPEKMIKHAQKLSKIAKNIIIKVPASVPGLICANELKKMGIKMNVTLIFHPSQAIPFIKLGVDYVSLFVGRVEDFGLSNKKAIWEIMESISKMGSNTKLISASIRNADYLIEAIRAGSDVLTIPPTCWKAVYNNPLFALGEKEFMESWKSLPESARKNYEEI